jgi:hypothetical protein
MKTSTKKLIKEINELQEWINSCDIVWSKPYRANPDEVFNHIRTELKERDREIRYYKELF